MKISEFIIRLEKLKESHGDIQVMKCDPLDDIYVPVKPILGRSRIEVFVNTVFSDEN